MNEEQLVESLGKRGRWTWAGIERVVEALGPFRWGRRDVLVGLRAGFQCEYCNRPLLATADDYKLWEVDHLVPRFHGGEEDDFDNLVLACLVCNSKLKNRWDPRSASEDQARGELIKATTRYLRDQRARIEKELGEMKRIIGL